MAVRHQNYKIILIKLFIFLILFRGIDLFFRFLSLTLADLFSFAARFVQLFVIGS